MTPCLRSYTPTALFDDSDEQLDSVVRVHLVARIYL